MLESEFTQVLDKYPEIMTDSKRFTAIMKDYFPSKRMEINLLKMLYDMDICTEIQQVEIINNTFAYRFVKRLLEEYGVSRLNADWAVTIWCKCYGQQILHKEYQLIEQSKNLTIQDESKKKATYDELFTYEEDYIQDGYIVTGFANMDSPSIIFQGSHLDKPVKAVKAYAFKEQGVQGIVLAEGYVKIGKEAFCTCINLKEVILPQTLEVIEDEAFSKCESLSLCTLPNQLQQIGSYAFSDTKLRINQLPSTVYRTGEGVFYNCKQILSFQWTNQIKQIPPRMFMGCENLKKIVIGEQIEMIGAYAFAGCSSLSPLWVPDSVQMIGEHAFQGVSDDFILLCSQGSYAEQYARTAKMKYQLI